VKNLLILSLSLFLIFISLFVVFRLTGLLTVDDVKHVLVFASEANVGLLGVLVILLLFLDLFISVPTILVVSLAGYFMGPVLGALFSVLGMLATGVSGYLISYFWGESLLLKVYKDKSKLDEMKNIFDQYSSVVLSLCRAAPMLPEVVCCLSGANKIKFSKFILFYSLGTVPYALFISAMGAKSTLEDPFPGIGAAVGVWAVLWLAWYVFFKKYKSSKNTA